MCLMIDKDKTEEVKNEDWKEKTFYKFLDVEGGKLKSPFTKYMWNKGINFPEKVDHIESEDGSITSGALHVHSKIEDAADWILPPKANGEPREYAIVKVVCKKKHFIARSEGGNYAFSEVHLSQEEYEAALRGERILESA